MPGHIDDLSNEVQAGNLAALHRAGAELGCVHPACGDFGLFIALGPGRIDGPAVERAFGFVEALVRPGRGRVQRQPSVGQAMGKNAADRAAGAQQITLRCLGAELAGPELAGRKIDHDRPGRAASKKRFAARPGR